MSKRGGFGTGGSSDPFASFNSFIQALPTQKESSSTPFGGDDKNNGPSTSFSNKQFSNLSNTGNDFNKENVNNDNSNFSFPAPGSGGRGGLGSTQNEETSSRGGFGGPARGRGGFSSGHTATNGFGSGNSEESSAPSHFGTPGRGRGAFGSSSNEEPSRPSNFGASGRGGRGAFGSFNNEESSTPSNFGTPGRGRGAFGSQNNEESSRPSNFGSSGRGRRGAFGSSNNEESSTPSSFGTPGRGRGAFGSQGNEESSRPSNFGSSGRRGRGGFGSSNSEESSGPSNFSTSGRGRGAFGSPGNDESSRPSNFSFSGRGGRGASNDEESSGPSNLGTSGRGGAEESSRPSNFGTSGRGRGAFGSQNSEETSKPSNFGSSGRGGRGGFGSSNNEESSGLSNFGTSGRGRGAFGSPGNDESSRPSNFSFSGRGGRGASINEESSGPSNLGTSGRGGRGAFGSSYNNEESSRPSNFGSSGRGGRGGGYSGGMTRHDNNEDGGDVTDFLGNMGSALTRTPASHVPIDRSIDVLLEEDQRNNVYYSQIADQDDEINVEGAKYQIKFDSWADCEFSKQLMANIKLTGYAKPRNIQAYTMPQIVNGFDIKGQAETGSGKTAAFLLPIIDDLIRNEFERKPRCPIAVVVSPTRELALQTHEQGRKFCNNTGVSVAKCYGQYKISENIAEIERGCDILSATPGRLKSFVQNGDISLECLKYFVLDEADELFGGSFVETIREILLIGGAPPKEKRLNMLFSATFPSGINDLANELLREGYVTIVNKCMNGANKKVTHEIIEVDRNSKNTTVCDILLKEMREAEANGGTLKRTLVFVSRKQQADMLSMFFSERGIQALSLNGDRPQKLREEALNNFRAHNISVLVTTDVCARGIDIKDLDHVINVDLPTEFVTFIHRVGRTGRLREGFATSFYDPTVDYNLKEELVDLLRFHNKEVPSFLQ
uniref:RNA helicase n=1 Tax=Strongyloides venezuelensis TaxID=75913 RepID=A0A0K0F4L6_STRVS